MPKSKYEQLTDVQLGKRKRFSLILFVILIVVASLNIVLVIYKLVEGDALNSSLLVTAVACLIISLPIYMGRKEITNELERRNLS